MNEEKFRKVNQFNKCFRAEDSPSILCICGESGSGKSTLAKKILEYRESNENIHPTVVLDGDGVRHFVTPDLGYSDEDRKTGPLHRQRSQCRSEGQGQH